jgi:vacuolar-type H+-ATPase subunit F/Vma7
VSRIVAIGERERIEGLSLAGVEVIPAKETEEVRNAWNELGRDVAVVILTAAAESALSELLPLRPERIWTRLPD